ncbi:hypothetical protein IEQ34_020183 [Dendrobium chrysotoxum]|uniref:Uncharacterized protein n=1 Tax=Dendrobium chrysotoxum TaxID=161865 RepID=A0AAV7FZH7_DENCH|nr:hypothetical protein IEQ34_020183 [Dendrobium chrysotoxum]
MRMPNDMINYNICLDERKPTCPISLNSVINKRCRFNCCNVMMTEASASHHSKLAPQRFKVLSIKYNLILQLITLETLISDSWDKGYSLLNDSIESKNGQLKRRLDERAHKVESDGSAIETCICCHLGRNFTASGEMSHNEGQITED